MWKARGTKEGRVVPPAQYTGQCFVHERPWKEGDSPSIGRGGKSGAGDRVQRIFEGPFHFDAKSEGGRRKFDTSTSKGKGGASNSPGKKGLFQYPKKGGKETANSASPDP